MKKNKLTTLLVAGILSLSVLTGCSTSNATLDFSKEDTVIEFKNDIYRFTLGAEQVYTPEEFSANLGAFLDTLSDEEKEEYIEYYIRGMYNTKSSLDEKLGLLGYELEDIMSEYNLDSLTSITMKDVSDEHATCKGFVTEVEKEGFLLTKDVSTGLIAIDINLDNIIKEYGSYLSTSLKDYYSFNNYELKNNFFTDNDEININEIASRINTIEKGIETDKSENYKHIDKWMSSYEYYYSILLGIQHEYFVSSGYVKDSVISTYEELANTYKGTELGDNLSKAVEIINKANGEFTSDVISQLEDIIVSKYTSNDNEISNAVNSLIDSNMTSDEVSDLLGIDLDNITTDENSNGTASSEEATNSNENTSN